MKSALLCLALLFSIGGSAMAAGGTAVVLTPWANVSVTNTPVGLTNIVAVAAGLDDALALRDDGTVVAWGANEYGITNVPATLSNVVAVSSGWLFHMALQGDGTVVTWGHSSTAVPKGLSNVVAIAAGGHQFCLALRTDRTVVSWGWNGSGQTNVPTDLTNVIAVAAGLDHSLALREDGTVAAWGDTLDVAGVPTNLTDVVGIAAGWSQSYALRADGTVVGWGSQAANLPVNLSNVVAVAGGWDAGKEMIFQDGSLLWNYGISNVIAVARGHFFAVAIRAEEGLAAASSVPLLSPSWAAGRFEAGVVTRYGRVYAPQFKDRLTDDGWISSRLLPGTGRVRLFEDPGASGPQRFYRILRW